MSQRESTLDRVVALKVSEETTGQDVHNMTEAVRRAVMQWGRIRVLVEVDGFRNMDPEGLLAKLGFFNAHALEIEKMALVCRRVWIKAWLQAGGVTTPNEVRVFDTSEAEDAWRWIRRS
jgi:hypothetical protein